MDMFLPLTNEVPLRLVPPPVAGVLERAAVAQARVRIAREPHWFNGPVLMCTRADAEGIAAYVADFALALAHRDGTPRLGLGPLAVTLDVHDGAGNHLVTRGPEWLLDAGWRPAAGGFVTPGETLRAAVLREAREEIGLEPAMIEECVPVALGVHAQGVLVGYRARLGVDVGALTLPSDEVVAWRYVMAAEFAAQMTGASARFWEHTARASGSAPDVSD